MNNSQSPSDKSEVVDWFESNAITLEVQTMGPMILVVAEDDKPNMSHIHPVRKHGWVMVAEFAAADGEELWAYLPLDEINYE